MFLGTSPDGDVPERLGVSLVLGGLGRSGDWGVCEGVGAGGFSRESWVGEMTGLVVVGNREG
ncbi:MAG: hypothetical protein ACI82F_001004 [Planctomycetota bacterium]|jgi:hypothetical protein